MSLFLVYVPYCIMAAAEALDDSMYDPGNSELSRFFYFVLRFSLICIQTEVHTWNCPACPKIQSENTLADWSLLKRHRCLRQQWASHLYYYVLQEECHRPAGQGDYLAS
ncbi:hypothetical protein H4582DRAFT_1450798 [Lactarius indigo]|nr:hypothetical protein H4582DRAFT_1450798 [Lactarius indigo]